MLDMTTFIQHCAPAVDSGTMSALIQVESSNHPYSIGVVGGRLVRQPVSHGEAVATAHQLDKDGWNFSIGLGQINRNYLAKHKINYNQAFGACKNLNISSKILKNCYVRAQKSFTQPQAALRAALSCYYSGNFLRGFKSEPQNKPSYVQKVVAYASKGVQPIPVVPAIQIDRKSEDTSNKNSSIKDSETKKPVLNESTSDSPDAAPVLLPSVKIEADANKEINQVEQPVKTVVF